MTKKSFNTRKRQSEMQDLFTASDVKLSTLLEFQSPFSFLFNCDFKMYVLYSVRIGYYNYIFYKTNGETTIPNGNNANGIGYNIGKKM